MDVEQEIEMRLIAKQTDTEQPVFVEVIGLYERSLFGFDVCRLLHLKCKCLRIVDGLHRVALFVETNACKQRRMRCYCCFNGSAQPLSVKTTVEDVDKRNIITCLALVCDTLHIEAVLYF